MSIIERIYHILRAGVSERLQEFRRSRGDEYQPPRSGGGKTNDAGEAGSGRQRESSNSSYEDVDMARWYANLEVPYGSDYHTVRQAWKRLVREYHPDKHGADPEKQQLATEILKQLNLAYEQLEKRLKP